jgi:predicted dienelactone hydrolase
MKLLFTFPLWISLSMTVSGQAFKAGYRTLFLTDSTRVYKPNSQPGEKLHFRPLEVDIWYPAEIIPGAVAIPFERFIDLLEQRTNRFQDDSVYTGISAALVKYLCANLNISDVAKLKRLRTSSYKNVNPVKQRFPLILYMCAYDGMSYENITLLESLASHGYIVAAISSVGRYPGNMSTKPADLMEQVWDGLFTLKSLQKQDNVYPESVGVIGYSWGGLAASLMAMQYDKISAIMSLDGAEMHYYGGSLDEDNDFDTLRNAPYFQKSKVRVPYTYLESGHKQDDYSADSIFNMQDGSNNVKRYYRFVNAAHEDFSGLSTFFSTASGISIDSNKLYQQFCHYSLIFFDEYLKYKATSLRDPMVPLLRQHLADTSYSVSAGTTTQKDFILKGVVKDGQTGNPLQYVNIGIPRKNMGTVSAQNGSFRLPIGAGNRGDSIRVSMVGYRDTTYSIALERGQGEKVFFLQPNITKLKEAVITAQLRPAKTIGNTTTSKSMSFGFPLKFLGSEIGSRMQLGKKNVLLKSFHFTVAENRLDTAVFRLNIYRILNGLPAENILPENILVGVGTQTGTYSIDLSNYRLLMQGEVFVSLEWVQGSSGRKNGAIFLSAALLRGTTWHRTASQGRWKRFNAVGVGFNMTVQPLTDE